MLGSSGGGTQLPYLEYLQFRSDFPGTCGQKWRENISTQPKFIGAARGATDSLNYPFVMEKTTSEGSHKRRRLADTDSLAGAAAALSCPTKNHSVLVVSLVLPWYS